MPITAERHGAAQRAGHDWVPANAESHDSVFLSRTGAEARHAARLDDTYTAKVLKAVMDGPVPSPVGGPAGDPAAAAERAIGQLFR
ncbi:hypothetical protein [Micromonospora sp. NPDC005367]|uniref:hypothetical protein n=1 Tax=Micromonospora sp. NPDC005367 TaxID=3155590 RepID=UPI0033A310CA